MNERSPNEKTLDVLPPARRVRCDDCGAQPGTRCLWENELGKLVRSDIEHAVRRKLAKFLKV